MGIKMKATLPPWQMCGLGEIRDLLLESPDVPHQAIVTFDVVEIRHAVVEGDLIPTPVIRLLRFEPETDPHEAARLLQWARRLTDRRTPGVRAPEPTLPGLDLPTATGLHVVTGGESRA